MTRSWLMLAAGDERQHGGNEGYKDVPAETYIWDSTVPHHGAPSAGDAIALWDKHLLLGASVIDRIDEGSAAKTVFRCQRCGSAHIKRRKTLTPLWRCFRCFENFEHPVARQVSVRTYTSRHDVAWTDLHGVLTGSQLRALCESPRSILSLRPLRWLDFCSEVERVMQGLRLTVVQGRMDQIGGGHTLATVRVRLGQAEFRNRLLAENGPVCALTGPAPTCTLEAGHLYSYAAVGEHYRYGGLLLRRDVHRLFDLGHIAVDPTSLRIDLDPSTRRFAGYSALHRRSPAVELTASHLAWLRQHWARHRAMS